MTIDNKHLKYLISKNKLVEVINILLDKLNNSKKYKDYYNSVVQFSSRYWRIDSEFKQSIIDRRDYQLEINRIEYSILELLDGIELGLKSYYSSEAVNYGNKIKDNNRYTESIKLAELGIWEWTTSKEYHSPIWKIMLGYEEDEFPSETIDVWQSLLHPDDKNKALQEFNSFIKGKIEKYEALFRLLCRNGQYKWIISKAKITKRLASGKAKQIIGIHQDASYIVTEQVKYSNLLQKNIELQKTIDILKEEREKISQELSELFPRQSLMLNELITKLETIENELGDKFPSIFDITTDMENIVSLINQSILIENKVQSQYEKDFELTSTIDYIVHRLNKIFKPKGRILVNPNYINIKNKVLNGYIEQTRSVLYWLIKFIYRNTSSKELCLVIEEINDSPSKEVSDEICYKFSVHSNLSSDLTPSKIAEIYKYINFQHERSEFIQNELNNGFRQVYNIIKLIDGKIQIDTDYKDNSNGIYICLKFSI